MNVLVNEAEPGAADHEIELLESAGHRVLRCHRREDGPFPCVGLQPAGVCPLHEPGIDVAVTVRSQPRSRPSLLEDGIACALRARVPVVVSGNVFLHPYEDLGVDTVEGEHVVGAVERVAMAPSPGHGEVATEALRDALDAASGDVIATVTRSRSRLRVVLQAAPTIDAARVKAVIPRVVAALRAYDRDTPRIDVNLATNGALVS
ncbi:MAG TPA: hypothetical protein VF152_14260 [Acidimicrobiia bacterium]